MKKLSILSYCVLCIGTITILFTSCNNKGSFNNPADSKKDSVAMAMGLVYGSQNKQQIMMFNEMQNANIDIDLFLKGLKDGLGKSGDSTINSYLYGLQTGIGVGAGNIADSISNKIFYDYFAAAMHDDSTKSTWTMEQASDYLQVKSQEMQEEKMLKEYGKNKEDGIAYMEEFKKEDGVEVLPSGVAYKVLKEGDGKNKPTEKDSVKVKYRGTLIDGSEFDKSEEPITFEIQNVIKGWQIALQEMTVGEKIKVVIPQELAYGSRQHGQKIAPFSTLIFEVELLEINPQK